MSVLPLHNKKGLLYGSPFRYISFSCKERTAVLFLFALCGAVLARRHSGDRGKDAREIVVVGKARTARYFGNGVFRMGQQVFCAFYAGQLQIIQNAHTGVVLEGVLQVRNAYAEALREVVKRKRLGVAGADESFYSGGYFAVVRAAGYCR